MRPAQLTDQRIDLGVHLAGLMMWPVRPVSRPG
jgi:hypothetical protein